MGIKRTVQMCGGRDGKHLPQAALQAPSHLITALNPETRIEQIAYAFLECSPADNAPAHTRSGLRTSANEFYCSLVTRHISCGRESSFISSQFSRKIPRTFCPCFPTTRARFSGD